MSMNFSEADVLQITSEDDALGEVANYSNTMLNLVVVAENFVTEIEQALRSGKAVEEIVGFNYHTAYPWWSEAPLGQKYYGMINQFMALTSYYVEFSPRIDVLVRVLHQSQLSLPTNHSDQVPGQYGVITGAVVFNNLVQNVAIYLCDPGYTSVVNARKEQANANFRSMNTYVNQLFAKYSRLEVIRLDLGYAKEWRDWVTLEQAMANIERFFNNRHHNKLFKHMVGYIRKVEWSTEKRFHFHLVLFFDGAQLWTDSHQSMMVGEYWNTTITQGKGKYYSCNLSKSNYKRLGIGTVKHDDQEKRENLKLVIGYLCKSEQYLRVRSVKYGAGIRKVRSIVRGQPPVAKSNRGRPRQSVSQDTGDAGVGNRIRSLDRDAQRPFDPDLIDVTTEPRNLPRLPQQSIATLNDLPPVSTMAVPPVGGMMSAPRAFNQERGGWATGGGVTTPARCGDTGYKTGLI